MSDHKDKKCIDWPTAFFLLIGWCVGQGIISFSRRIAFEEDKAAIMAKDIPPLEKCMQLLQLLEPK